MKNLIFTALFVFFFTEMLSAGNNINVTVTNVEEIPLSLNVTAGYVPSVNALKSTIAFNNFLLQRIGAYTSLETGLDTRFLSNIYGITCTLQRYIYLWGGVEFFTKNGLLNGESEEYKSVRKEIGIGILPVKNLVVKGGWSKSVGVTFEAGIRIPINFHFPK